MKKMALVLLLVSGFMVNDLSFSAVQSESGIQYIPGGRCPVADLIQVPKGFPKCPDRATWLGVFKGSWYDIGKQWGESKPIRDYIPYVFDFYFNVVNAKYKLPGVINTLHKIGDEIRLYNPVYMEMFEGAAAGASPALAKAKNADKMTDYEKILFLNAWPYFTFGYYAPHDCTQIALLPKATVDGKLIVGRNTQSGFGMGGYSFSYAAIPPPPARPFWANGWSSPLQLHFA